MILDALARIPDADVARSPEIDAAIAHSVAYLGSDRAAESLAADTYWPKWDSPWWHMLLLWELGEARQIPERAVTAMVDGLGALPIQIFPIHPHESPPGSDPYRDSSCHCAVGSMYQVLAACGVDLDRALPWFPRWFTAYQMADGGLNCDADAYRVDDECPSSMVGTIALFEAMTTRGPRSAAERAFGERAAAFLIERQLVHGSTTRFNAAERDAAPAWRRPAFPRFYFYDVLRGLAAVVRWAERTPRALPADAIAPAIAMLVDAFPDGVVRVSRRAHDGKQTLARGPDGAWHREPARAFPLLDAVSVLDHPSEVLTRSWRDTRAALRRIGIAPARA